MPDLKKPTRLFLVRHGEVVRQGQGKFLGFTDLKMSFRGKKQIQGLAEYLKGITLDQVYASDLIRAADSAGIICRDRKVKPVFRPAFREMNMGDWDGKSWEDVRKNNSEINPRYFYNLKKFYFPGGENWSQFRSRVLKGMELLLREGQGKKILLAAHAGVNRVILARALGLRYRNMFHIAQGYGCLNIIEYYETGARVILMNGIFYK
ncbi:MAG: histidine phosphatase family protein [Syntrophales bacterium LBB04]|jgi:alpha-ribazole phosphatase|nr:histidine phosphatase family protein [Syntrophales bacterium LBB04]